MANRIDNLWNIYPGCLNINKWGHSQLQRERWDRAWRGTGGPLGLTHWTVFPCMHLLKQIEATWVWRVILSQSWSVAPRSYEADALGSAHWLTCEQKPIRATGGEQCSITAICTCFDKGLSAPVPPVCRGTRCNICRGLWECRKGRKPQFNSMCAASSELSGLLNQLHSVVEPAPLTHITPIVSVCLYWMDQIRTCW